MFYEYICDECSLTYESQTFRKIGCVLSDCFDINCDGELVRIVSIFNVSTDGEPYYNHTVGQMVTSNKDFERKLRIGAEQQSERTGTLHTYTPVYPDEAKRHHEKVASNDGNHGESMERYGTVYNLTDKKKKIIT
jgi:hypothetical protein